MFYQAGIITNTLIQDGTTTSKTFVHTPSIIEAEEAEEDRKSVV